MSMPQTVPQIAAQRAYNYTQKLPDFTRIRAAAVPARNPSFFLRKA
jgi:hypothetical protein